MAYDEGLAQRLREVLEEEQGITEKQMFGGVAFLQRGSMVVGIVRDDLMVRVGPAQHEAALARPHARPMDFSGRPMKGFVYVAPEGIASDASLSAWVRLALDFTSSQPAKVKKPAPARKPSTVAKAGASKNEQSPVEQVFTAGVRVWGGEGVRATRDLGGLAAPSGALILGDPLELATSPRLSCRAGARAIHVATVRISGIHEVAAVRLDLAPGTVRRWKKSRKGCAIDSATAVVCDAGLASVLRDEAQRRRFVARWERFAQGSQVVQRARFAEQDVVLLQVCDDGRYPLWEGTDGAGRVVAVAVLWARTALG